MPKKDEILEAQGMPDPEEYVTFTAPQPLTEQDDDLFLSVNGENVRIKLGETVKIKRKFLEVWEHSQEQKRALMEAKRRAKDLASKPVYM